MMYLNHDTLVSEARIFHEVEETFSCRKFEMRPTFQKLGHYENGIRISQEIAVLSQEEMNG